MRKKRKKKDRRLDAEWTSIDCGSRKQDGDGRASLTTMYPGVPTQITPPAENSELAVDGVRERCLSGSDAGRKYVLP